MNVHQQYNLVYRIRNTEILGKMPICDTIVTGKLENELSSFINMSNGKWGGEVDVALEVIQKILDGYGNEVEEVGDDFFVTETNEAIRLDLNDGYAYLGQEDYGWSELPKIPLTDLKAIFEEWISFRDSVYNG